MRLTGLAGLALRQIRGSAYRSWLIGACAMVMTAFALATILVAQGAQDSLGLARDRLGADIVVMPHGSESGIEGALLMGEPVRSWMPAADVAGIAAVPGVAAASPQLYLASLTNVTCCSVSDMLMVAYDPATDFTLKPWLRRQLGGDLGLGEAVGGRFVTKPTGPESLKLYGYSLTLKGNLQATGTNLDRTLFITFDTAREMARRSATTAVRPLMIPDDSVSSVLVKLRPGSDPAKVAEDIARAVPGVTPVRSPDMFGAYRRQISGVLRGTLVVLGLTVVLAVAVLALMFSMEAHERRRQIGVLRALGATRGGVLASFLTEAGLLALAGGLAGVVIAAAGVFLFRTLLVTSLGFPFLLPSAARLAAFVAGGLVLALVVVTLAAIVPALRVCRQEPADSMRE